MDEFTRYLLIVSIVLLALVLLLLLFVFTRTGQQRAQQLEQNCCNSTRTTIEPTGTRPRRRFDKAHEHGAQQTAAMREHASVLAREQREELGQNLFRVQSLMGDELKAVRETKAPNRKTRETLLKQLTQTTTQLVQQLQQLNDTTERRMNHMRENIEQRLTSIRQNNAKNSKKCA